MSVKSKLVQSIGNGLLAVGLALSMGMAPGPVQETAVGFPEFEKLEMRSQQILEGAGLSDAVQSQGLCSSWGCWSSMDCGFLCRCIKPWFWEEGFCVPFL